MISKIRYNLNISSYFLFTKCTREIIETITDQRTKHVWINENCLKVNLAGVILSLTTYGSH